MCLNTLVVNFTKLESSDTIILLYHLSYPMKYLMGYKKYVCKKSEGRPAGGPGWELRDKEWLNTLPEQRENVLNINGHTA